MRLNRNTRIGLLLIGAALILLLFVKLFKAVSTQPPVVAQSAANAAPAPPAPPASGRYVAKIAIPDHTLITTAMLKPSQAPKESNSDASLYVTDLSQLVGYVTSRTVSAGESLKSTDLIGHISTVGVSGMLRPGTRAQVIPVPNKTILHDLVAIGDTVDVIASFDGQESRTIVQNVRVLAVDIYGGDFAPVKVARRGDYHAELAPGAAPPPPPPAAGGAPAGPGATPTPTPTPEGPPPPKPDPAITLEVTPDQAAAIALAQNSAAALDIILRPSPAVTTVAEARMVSINKAKLAPYANRMKTNPTGAKPAAPAHAVSVPSFAPPKDMGPVVQPQPVNQLPVGPETYQIPIYGDGKVTRVDTVRKP